jgi:hypothetical protein
LTLKAFFVLLLKIGGAQMNSKAGSSNRRLQILLEEHGIPVPQNTYLRKVYVRFIENGDHVAQFSGYRNPQERAVVLRRMCEECLNKEIISNFFFDL